MHLLYCFNVFFPKNLIKDLNSNLCLRKFSGAGKGQNRAVINLWLSCMETALVHQLHSFIPLFANHLLSSQRLDDIYPKSSSGKITKGLIIIYKKFLSFESYTKYVCNRHKRRKIYKQHQHCLLPYV